MTKVEVFYFDGCPNHVRTLEMVERIVQEIDPGMPIQAINVTSEAEAHQHKFLGSPTVRIDDHDIEPGADGRTGYQMACRIYHSRDGLSGLPDEAWIRDALAQAKIQHGGSGHG